MGTRRLQRGALSRSWSEKITIYWACSRLYSTGSHLQVKCKSHLFFLTHQISLIIYLPFMRELMLEGLRKLLKMTARGSGRTGLEIQVHPTPEPTVFPPGGSEAEAEGMNKLSWEQNKSALRHTPGPSPPPPSWALCSSWPALPRLLQYSNCTH